MSVAHIIHVTYLPPLSLPPDLCPALTQLLSRLSFRGNSLWVGVECLLEES